MSVNGVCVAGYPITGYETRRKEQNEVGGDFVKQAAEAVQASGRVSTTLYGADKETGDITVFSGAEVVTGHLFPFIRHRTLIWKNLYI